MNGDSNMTLHRYLRSILDSIIGLKRQFMDDAALVCSECFDAFKTCYLIMRGKK